MRKSNQWLFWLGLLAMLCGYGLLRYVAQWHRILPGDSASYRLRLKAWTGASEPTLNMESLQSLLLEESPTTSTRPTAPVEGPRIPDGFDTVAQQRYGDQFGQVEYPQPASPAGPVVDEQSDQTTREAHPDRIIDRVQLDTSPRSRWWAINLQLHLRDIYVGGWLLIVAGAALSSRIVIAETGRRMKSGQGG